MNPPELITPPNPLILVLSGPSGVGKDFMLSRLKARPIAESLALIITNTTRPIRAGEAQDVDYHFVTEAEFQDMLSADELLEYAEVYGNWYGVSKKPVRTALAAGRNAVIKVDVQGARTIKLVVPQAVSVFISPSSLGELAERLRKRNTESTTDLSRRLKTAEAEMAEMPRFDYVVVNGNGQADQALACLEAIITAERLRVKPREYRL